MGMQATGQFRIHEGKLTMQVVGSLQTRLLHHTNPEGPIGRGPIPEPPNERPNIEPRAADHQGHPTASVYSINLGEGQPAVHSHVEGLVGVHQID